jgi:hypothetical protein
MTNYEQIKNMSIEEMAVTIMCPNDISMTEADIKCDDYNYNCCKCIQKWLRQEAEKNG